MPDPRPLFQVTSKPGIQRDGTTLDSQNFVDGQWVRFYRTRARKMGGFVQVTDNLTGPIRKALVWSRAALNGIFSFSPTGVEMVLVDNNGLGSSIVNRTPAGFMADSDCMWSVDTQYDDAVSSTGTVVLAHASTSLRNIDDTTAFKPYLGLAASNTAFTQIADAPAVSGGVFSVAPYTFVHGSDGFIAWSDVNQPQVWHTSSGNIGDAGADRVTGAKIVKGLPLRSGSGPAALLWSLDSVLRMDYSGGGNIFRFSHLSTQSSILSQNSVVEYDGAYFWLGIDRFLACDGGKVQELPNQMNLNWFFDNLNYAQRQKVWGMKVPRYGEIHWYFPYGREDECTHCVIFNTVEKTWYDNRCSRSAGFHSQVLRYPVMMSSAPTGGKSLLTLSGITGTVSVGDSVYGTTSGATGTVLSVTGTVYTVSSDGGTFVALEGLEDSTSGATATVSSIADTYQAFIHEKGVDQVVGDQVTAIESYFETADFGFPTGGPQSNQVQGVNRWTRLIRIEPDFLQEGVMDVKITGREFANAPETVSSGYNFTNATEKIDMREQRREIRLKFTSNVVGGDYQMGRVLLHLEPGDVRN